MDESQFVRDRSTPEAFWNTVAEAYVEGWRQLHLHFRAGFIEGGVTGNWCTIFNRAEHRLDFINRKMRREKVGERNVHEKDDVGQPVFVFNGELVELPERIVRELLPSVVRLQLLNDFLRARINASEHAVQFFHSPVGFGGKDGESGFSLDTTRQWLLFICDGEFEGAMGL